MTKISGRVPSVPGANRLPSGIEYEPSSSTWIRRILPRRSFVLPAPRRESKPGFMPGASLFGAKPFAPGVLAGVLSPVVR
ncbi:Uncharacterised protein [Mycobacteroides abscessus]|nr:Uncharacterised protein [Mycobacteroides abscessus]